MLGVVLELLIVEKDLLARCKYKIGAAVNAFQDSIGKLHGRLPSQETDRSRPQTLAEDSGLGSLSTFKCTTRGPDRTKKRGGYETFPVNRVGDRLQRHSITLRPRTHL
jgi:hypothetical protein